LLDKLQTQPQLLSYSELSAEFGSGKNGEGKGGTSHLVWR